MYHTVSKGTYKTGIVKHVPWPVNCTIYSICVPPHIKKQIAYRQMVIKYCLPWLLFNNVHS